VKEVIMTRMIFALAAALFASSLFAEEEIYLYSSYKNSAGNSIRYKMDCLDSRCKINNSKERSVSLSREQRDQILAAFQAETRRFDLKGSPKSSDRLVKIKFRYLTDRKRLQISMRLPDDRLDEVSPEMTAVLETYLELNLTNLKSPQLTTGNEKPAEKPE
jgi:hypothetical protein